jgi:hypothetical protein
MNAVRTAQDLNSLSSFCKNAEAEKVCESLQKTANRKIVTIQIFIQYSEGDIRSSGCIHLSVDRTGLIHYTAMATAAYAIDYRSSYGALEWLIKPEQTTRLLARPRSAAYGTGYRTFTKSSNCGLPWPTPWPQAVLFFLIFHSRLHNCSWYG